MHCYCLPHTININARGRRTLLLIFFLLGTLIDPSLIHAQSGSSWLCFRGNPSHTGTSALEGPAGPANAIEVKWRWQVNGRRDPISASPAVTEDGTVIIGTEGGYIAAIQPEGAMSWSMSLGSPILSSPAVDDSGNIFAVTSDGYMYFISAIGETIWKSPFERSTSSSPVLSGSEAYLGTDDDELLTINLSPDMSQSGDSKKLPWYLVRKSSFLAKGNVLSSPAFSGNSVFFGGGEYIYALNPNAETSGGGTGGGTGEGSSTTTTAGNGGGTTVNPVKWWFRANGDVNSSPAVSNGKVYVGADDGYLYAFSENTAGSSTEALFPGLETSLNWSVLASNTTNEPLWKRKTGGKIRTSPAVTPPVTSDDVFPAAAAATRELIYVGADDGYLYCYDDIGQLKWKFSAGSPIHSSPAVDSNGDIYFGADNGNVYALYPDGALKWVYQTRGPVRSSPAIGPDKKLYVGSNDGFLYCIGESDEETREPDFVIENAASPDSIENDGNPAIITTSVTSQSEDTNILSRIASVTADLTPLLLSGIIDPDTLDIADITTVTMLDDGQGEDATARDGIFTFSFGITVAPENIDYDPDSGIFTYYVPEELLAVGPVPVMITVQDIYGHRVSKPFPLKIAQKTRGSLPPGTALDAPLTINNRLSQQTLDISFSSGTPSIQTIVPFQGAPGVVPIAIQGLNTNFIKNRTRVEIFNDAGIRIAKAEPVPGTNEVEVLSDTSLTALLTISDPSQVTSGNLFGTWDVIVTTPFTAGADCTVEGACEIVIARNAFTITSSVTTTIPATTTIPLLPAFSSDLMTVLQGTCNFTLDALNAAGVRPNDAPWTFNSGYERTITIDRAAGGPWLLDITLGDCDDNQSFKIIAEGSNVGYVTGQVTNGYTSNRIDGVTITALTGEGPAAAGNSTVSSGGGYYMLPLPATRDKYTIIASKDGLVNIKDDVLVTADEETRQDFTLKAELKCPITATLQGRNPNNFYAMRDRLLLKTPQGQRWVALYYRYAPEVTRIILANDSLRKQAAAFIASASLEAGKLLRGEKVDGGFKSRLAALIEALRKQASPELRRALSAEKEAILSFLRTE